jgi:hypothetical protein
LEISLFVYFIVQILFHKFNGVQSVLLFKILNDVAVYRLIVRSEIFNLDHEMETLHSISNEEDHLRSYIAKFFIFYFGFCVALNQIQILSHKENKERENISKNKTCRRQ